MADLSPPERFPCNPEFVIDRQLLAVFGGFFFWTEETT
jgi:hypothetical protein